MVANIKAIDMDLTGSKIQYELPGEMQQFFHINPSTGVITMQHSLPETRKDFHFNIIAKDSGNPPKQAVARVTVRTSECEDEMITTVEDVSAISSSSTATIISIPRSTPQAQNSTTTTVKPKTSPQILTTTAELEIDVLQNKTFNKLGNIIHFAIFLQTLVHFQIAQRVFLFLVFWLLKWLKTPPSEQKSLILVSITLLWNLTLISTLPLKIQSMQN